jgi:large subunit ribosomal protein L17
MRHGNRRGKLGRKSAHRMMMLRNLATSLFDKERIKTTMPKAKQLRPFAEKLITLARRQDLHSRRLTLRYIHDKKVVKKLFDEISKRYENGKGGYTRIVPYRPRWGDGAELAFIELTTAVLPEPESASDKRKKKKKAAAKEAPAIEPKRSRRKEAVPGEKDKKKA